MKKSKNILFSVLLILALGISFVGISSFQETSKNAIDSPPTKSILLGLTIKDNDNLIPYFLKTLDNIDYPKDLISIQLNICNTNEAVKKEVHEWIEKNRNAYKDIQWEDNCDLFIGKESSTEKNRIFGTIKEEYLIRCQNQFDYCCILSSDVFLNPHTLRYLIPKNKPIIAPLLRPTPDAFHPFRNYFCDITPAGYYQDHPDYYPIAICQKRGTFKVPCVHAAYLIQSQYADQLSFLQNFVDWEFLAFSKNARESGIDQYLCNEKEFGNFLFFADTITDDQLHAYSFIGADLKVDSALLDDLLSPYYTQNPNLQKQVENFNFADHAIYRIQNRDLFYMDDANDPIKNKIKLGKNGEEGLQEKLQNHVKPGSIAVDIGAHVGNSTLNLSKLVGETGTVHAFEPQASLFCELAVNMHLNGCQNVVMYPHTFGNKENEINNPKILRLDDFHFDNLSFIKINAEGHEMEILNAGLETIQRHQPVILIKITHGPEFFKKINDIKSLGYTFASHIGDDCLFVPSK